MTEFKQCRFVDAFVGLGEFSAQLLLLSNTQIWGTSFRTTTTTTTYQLLLLLLMFEMFEIYFLSLFIRCLSIQCVLQTNYVTIDKFSCIKLLILATHLFCTHINFNWIFSVAVVIGCVMFSFSLCFSKYFVTAFSWKIFKRFTISI